MAYNSFNKCGAANANTGVACTPDIGAPLKPFLTKEDFEYSTQTDADTLATVNAAIVAQNVFPLPEIDEFGDNSEEDTKYTSPINSVQRTTKKGKTVHQYSFVLNPSLNNRIQALDGTTMRYYYIDTNGHQIGTSPDEVKFKGFKVYVNVDKWKDSTGDNPAFAMITLTFINNIERDGELAVFEATYDPLDINGVLPAVVTSAGAAGATSIPITVTDKDTGLVITGLETANFIFLQDSDGAEETITSSPESPSGTYTLAGVAFETGKVGLRDVVTVAGKFYESNQLAVTI